MSITLRLADFRYDMSADIIQLPDATWLRWYNDGRDKIIDAITEEKEDYFYNYITTNTVIGQNEYRIPKRWDLASDWVTVLDWLNKIKSVTWKVQTADTEYTVLRPVAMESLDYEIESYDKTSIPFYCVMDNSVFIYPAPTEVSSIKIHWITYPKKLILSDIDTLPDQYTKAIMLYVKTRWFDSQNRIAESQVAEWRFEAEVIRLCKAMSWRIESPIQRECPNLSYLS